MFAAKNELFTRPSGYTISRSVRLRSSASAYFNRTPAGAGNQSTWTWSGWVKRGSLGATYQMLFGADSGGGGGAALYFYNDNLCFGQFTTTYRVSTAVYRDPSAWYHVVCALDTTQATANNRVRIYVNGVEVTAFSTLNNPTQNSTLAFNGAVNHAIGADIPNTGARNFLDGYLTEINFVNAQGLSPTSFGQFNSVTGVWQPLKYTGTYGTNGFYLNFSDNSNNTATTIGKDYSGNGNNWTPNNISVTSGVTYDSMIDVPTLYADGGNGRGNYQVMNPLEARSNRITPTDGNLTVQLASGTNGYFGAKGNMGITTGKWYWEVTAGAKDASAGEWFGVGVVADNVNWPAGNGLGSNSGGYEYLNDGYKWGNASASAYGASWTTNDVIGVALDADAQTLTFYKNGVSQGTAFTSIGSGSNWLPTAEIYRSTGTTQALYPNFGQRPFAYTPPSGFVALNTQNLPAPTISNGALYMAATLYTGNGTSQTITNGGNNTIGTTFKPDFVWYKNRSIVASHNLFDSVRGVNQYLISDSTAAEGTASGVTAFNSNGFSVGSLSNGNGNGNAIVAWQWQAGQGTTSSNTSGSITSTVSVNATAGFSIVTYTGTGANATVGHGLGVAPSMVIVKQRNVVQSWVVWQTAIAGTDYLLLNSTAAKATAASIWNSTTPTSTVFSIGTDVGTNQSTGTYVAYCFNAVRGYSAFGSYTGNGSSDGPFVFTGFRPRWLMYKRTDVANSWVVLDSSRSTYNVTNNALIPNLADAEYANEATLAVDFLSNGFKVRTTGTAANASGGTYVYAAFAENPYKLALAR